MTLQDGPYTHDFLLERTGKLSQAGGISHFTHAEGKAKGVLQMLSPGERREFRLELGLLSGAEQVANAIRAQLDLT